MMNSEFAKNNKILSVDIEAKCSRVFFFECTQNIYKSVKAVEECIDGIIINMSISKKYYESVGELAVEIRVEYYADEFESGGTYNGPK